MDDTNDTPETTPERPQDAIDAVVAAHIELFPRHRRLYLEPRYGAVYHRNLDRTSGPPGVWSENDEVVGYNVLRDEDRSNGDLEPLFSVERGMIDDLPPHRAAEWMQTLAMVGDARRRAGKLEGERGVHDRLRDFLGVDVTPDEREAIDEESIGEIGAVE
jgi:hypothetical protein